MAQTYRTTDATRWGTGKGSRLAPVEVDINFWDIIQAILQLQADMPDAAASIDHFEVVGTQFYVHMINDTSILGPYDLPQLDLSEKGEWQSGFSYAVNDIFTINGGLYRVIYPHTSETTFDAGANDGLGNDYYSLWIQTPGSALPTGGAVGQVVQKASLTEFAVTWGWKLPTGGTARQFLVQQSGTQDDAEWETPQADDIAFTPTTSSVLTSTNVADAIEEVSNATALGRQTAWIPASAMSPLLTDGAEVGQVETGTHNVLVKTLDFDPSTPQYAQFEIAMPRSWDLGSIYFKVFWSHAAAATFGVTWELNAISIANGDTLDVAMGASASVSDTGGTTNDLYVSDESDELDVLAAAYGSMIIFQLSRDPLNASDTLDVDARLHGIQLFYVANASTDDE